MFGLRVPVFILMLHRMRICPAFGKTQLKVIAHRGEHGHLATRCFLHYLLQKGFLQGKSINIRLQLDIKILTRLFRMQATGHTIFVFVTAMMLIAGIAGQVFRLIRRVLDITAARGKDIESGRRVVISQVVDSD